MAKTEAAAGALPVSSKHVIFWWVHQDSNLGPAD